MEAKRMIAPHAACPLAAGDTVTLWKFDRKWKAYGEYLVAAIRERDVDLCHAKHHFREAVPLFDIRRGTVQLTKAGRPVTCGKNPDFKLIIDNHINRLIDKAVYECTGIPRYAASSQEACSSVFERKRMTRNDIRTHCANGIGLDELVQMYSGYYPEMSQRMLRVKIIGYMMPQKATQTIGGE